MCYRTLHLIGHSFAIRYKNQLKMGISFGMGIVLGIGMDAQPVKTIARTK